MSAERKKILEMLAAGTISPEDAERLLDKVSGVETGTEGSGETEDAASPAGAATGALKYLRVLVDSPDGDKVNIRVPIALVRTGISLATVLPDEASEKIADSGIDLSQLSKLKGEELIEALRELEVNVDSSDGETVRIFCE